MRLSAVKTHPTWVVAKLVAIPVSAGDTRLYDSATASLWPTRISRTSAQNAVERAAVREGCASGAASSTGYERGRHGISLLAGGTELAGNVTGSIVQIKRFMKFALLDSPRDDAAQSGPCRAVLRDAANTSPKACGDCSSAAVAGHPARQRLGARARRRHHLVDCGLDAPGSLEELERALAALDAGLDDVRRAGLHPRASRSLRPRRRASSSVRAASCGCTRVTRIPPRR